MTRRWPGKAAASTASHRWIRRAAADSLRRISVVPCRVIEWRLNGIRNSNPPAAGRSAFARRPGQRRGMPCRRPGLASRVCEFAVLPDSSARSNESVEGASVFELVPELETPSVRKLLDELADGKRDEARIDRPADVGSVLEAGRRNSRPPCRSGERRAAGDGLGNVGRCGRSERRLARRESIR